MPSCGTEIPAVARGAVLTVKDGHVDVRVSAGERAMIRSKAESYGVTVSELVLAAVSAYERTYGAELAEGEAVAVNYAAWLRVEQDLSRIEAVLRELAQQVVGTRRVLSALAEERAVSGGDAGRLLEVLRGCHAEASVARRSVTEALDRLDAACAARGIVDEGLCPPAAPVTPCP